MAKKQKRNISKDGTMTIKASQKYKMDENEVQAFLHMKRKGSYVGKDKTKYTRHNKHKGSKY